MFNNWNYIYLEKQGSKGIINQNEIALRISDVSKKEKKIFDLSKKKNWISNKTVNLN